ncbi:hypothetical protein O3G_MSEX013318, partial [Manduca sexta]
MTTTTPRIVYLNTDNIKYNTDATSPAANNFIDEELKLLMEQNQQLPVCGPFLEKNENDEMKNLKRRLAHNLFSEVKMGGYFFPKKCRSNHKVAILVPYRNRERNLAVFVYYMHTFLMKQDLEYRIFVIEQAGGELFNRGKLFNIGFTEMMKYNDWHCVVLHDVDILPLNKGILYTCPPYPRHMVGTVFEKSNLTYGQYRNFFGGASVLSVQHYKQINGYSNLYWGWGGEDNDMYWRILSEKLQIVSYSKNLARYTSLPRPESPRNIYSLSLFFLGNKGQVVKESNAKMDSGNGSTVDILKNIEPERFIMVNKGFPVCGSMMEQNNTNEYNKTDNRVKDNWISKVALGGYYNPKKCRSRHKVAILVPYRNREKNLAVFTNHMHPFLIKQQLEYRIFIIEQAGKEVFNRGKLFNIAFVEMMKYNDWHCVVLHDVDLLPQGDRILYTCPTFPRHMCGTVLEKAKLTYQQYHTLFGGVSALSVQHYKQINGFSNLLQISQIPIVRYNKTVALYKSLPHRGQPKNKYRYKLLAFTMAKYKTDGLSSLVYKVIWTKLRPLYTHILADVNPLREKITDVYSNMF